MISLGSDIMFQDQSSNFGTQRLASTAKISHDTFTCKSTLILLFNSQSILPLHYWVPQKHIAYGYYRAKTMKVASSSSFFYWPSVANAPNVLQPYWLIVLPLDVPALTASLLLWGPSGQRWRCLWTFLFSNVPTFATSRLQEILAAKGGTTWARNGR